MAYDPSNKLGVKVVPYDPKKKKAPTSTELAQGGAGGIGAATGDASGTGTQSNVDKAKAALGMTPPTTIGGVVDKVSSGLGSAYKFATTPINTTSASILDRGGMRPPGYVAPVKPESLKLASIDPIAKPIQASIPTPSGQTAAVSSTPVANTLLKPEAIAPDAVPLPLKRLGGMDGEGQQSASVTRPDGSQVFSDKQKDSLNSIIDRNADPAFKARLAEQVRIVDERNAKYGSNSLGNLEKQYTEALRTDNQALQHKLMAQIANREDNDTSRANNAATVGAATDAANTRNAIDIRKQMGADSIEQDKQDQSVANEVIKNINSLNKDGNPNPRDIYSQTATLLNGRPFTYNLFKQVHKDIPTEATSSKEGLAAFLNEAGYPQDAFNQIMNTSGF